MSNNTPLQFQPPASPDHELVPGLKPDKPLKPVFEFLGDIHRAYFEFMSGLLALAFVPAILAALVGIFDTTQNGIKLGEFLRNISNTYGFEAMIAGAVLFAVIAVGNAILELLLAPSIANHLHKKLSPFQSYKLSLSRTLSFLWLTLLVGFISLLGYLLLIIPGIIAQVSFSAVFMIAALEGKWGIEALIRSREYVRGRFADVFWRLLSAGLVALAFFVVASVGMGTLTAGLPDLLGLFLFNFVASLFIGSYMGLVVYMLYKQLSETRDLRTFVPTEKQRKSYTTAFTVSVVVVVLIAGAVVTYGIKEEQKKLYRKNPQDTAPIQAEITS